MSYAFSMADMRTYLSYLRTKKQEILFDRAADGADTTIEEEDEDDDKEAHPDTKRKRIPDGTETDDTEAADEDDDAVDTM